MTVLRTAGTLWQTFGWRGVVLRAAFEGRRRMNAFRATPARLSPAVVQTPLPDEWPFCPDRARVRDTADLDVALERATRVRDGQQQAFRWAWRPRPATPEEWLTNPETRYAYATRDPWWRVAHFDARAGDIKDVWEPARFAWAYDLARGWLITGDDAFAQALSDGIANFLKSSPPFYGPHWACGQETAIRAIAWLWAEGACHDAPSFSETVRGPLLEALAWSGERIADAFGYAQSQRNNHGLSEAAGLIAVGARLRSTDQRAAGWIDEGHRALERMIIDQIAPDGWYIQHSFNYARVALDQLTTASRALRFVGRDLSSPAQERVRALIELLATCMDPKSGQLPNHGANDGAYVLPLSSRPFRDFRPSLTAAAATFGCALPGDIEPNGETLAWLRVDPPARRAAPQAPWVRSGPSGWAVGATAGARIFVRAGQYRSRPGHIDPAHVDLWIEGNAAAIDAGTFRYAAPPPWNNGLAAIDVHNTVAIAGLSAARRGPRFLWLTWPRARIDLAALVDGEITIRITNESWRDSGIIHRRTCTLAVGGAAIVDELSTDPAFASPVHVHWLLEPGAAVDMTASEPSTLSEMRGDPTSTRGWASDSYGVKRAVQSLRLTAAPRQGKLRAVSFFGGMRDRTDVTVTTTSDAELPCST